MIIMGDVGEEGLDMSGCFRSIGVTVGCMLVLGASPALAQNIHVCASTGDYFINAPDYYFDDRGRQLRKNVWRSLKNSNCEVRQGGSRGTVHTLECEFSRPSRSAVDSHYAASVNNVRVCFQNVYGSNFNEDETDLSGNDYDAEDTEFRARRNGHAYQVTVGFQCGHDGTYCVNTMQVVYVD
jgi:hypothetical protein